MKNKKGNVALIAIIVVIVAITSSVLTWLVVKKSQVPAQQAALTKSTVPAPVEQNSAARSQSDNIAAPNDSSVLKIYSNQKYGFNLNYPGNYKIKETNWEQEPQPGGVIFTVSFGHESISDLDEINDNVISILVSKIEKGMANGEDHLAAPNGMDPISQKDTTIDGQKARIYNNGEVYTVAKNGYEYLLLAPGEQANQTTKDSFVKLVASFKFAK